MTLSRRQFLQVTAIAGGGISLGFSLPVMAHKKVPADDYAMPNAFIKIYPDNRITFVSPNTEMGQGIHTSHMMVIAEELGAHPDQFNAVGAPVDSRYNNPMFGMMGTGGSSSTPAFWKPLREAGASARTMLVAAAAAEHWNTKPELLTVADGYVFNQGGDKKLSYGAVAAAAVKQTVPENIPLKKPSEFNLIGQSTKRIEGPDKVKGEAVFGMDIDLPDMLIATIKRPAVIGAQVSAVNNKDKVKAMPGVHNVKTVTHGVAVIADSYWQARNAAQALDISWNNGENATLSSEKLYKRYAELSKQSGDEAEKIGQGDEALVDGKESVEATFYLPYLAHASMEPLNATAHVKADGAEVWAGTYFQTSDRGMVAKYLELPPEKVMIHTLLAGGAFGRRANADADFIMDAVEVAKDEGVPVKVIWSREDDTQGGYYRPLNVNRIEAVLGQDGRPDTWRQRIVSQSIVAGTPFASALIKHGIDETSVEGATKMPYSIPNRLIELHSPEVNVPVLWWRSVGHSYTAFVGEHFLDILAHKSQQDPLEYRRNLLASNEDKRFLGVLNLAAEKAGWGKKLPAGRAHGVALKKSFSSYVCQIAECSLDDKGFPVVHKVTAAVDVGIAINPWNIEQQIQGGINYGLTAALYGAIDIENGQVQQSNFDKYRILRMYEAPEIDVHIVESEVDPTGIGEPGVPPIAPAIANALLKLTGEATYRLPFIDRYKDVKNLKGELS